MSVNVKGLDGCGLADAGVALWMIDEAVLDIAGFTPPNPSETLHNWAAQKLLNPRVASSEQHQSVWDITWSVL